MAIMVNIPSLYSLLFLVSSGKALSRKIDSVNPMVMYIDVKMKVWFFVFSVK